MGGRGESGKKMVKIQTEVDGYMEGGRDPQKLDVQSYN